MASLDFEGDNMMLLTVVGEEEDGQEDGSTVSDETAKGLLAATKDRTAVLAAAAEKDMASLADLLGKVKTGTATCEEKARILSLHAKLDGMKSEIEKTKELKSATELCMLRTETKVKTKALATSLRMKEIRSAVKEVCAAESVDLAFIIDCTSSMHGHIAAVKTNVKNIVASIKRTNGNLRLRLAVVGYRDLCDGPKRFEVLDFSASIEKFENFVGQLDAFGGGDAPEDMAGAIQHANTLNWRHFSRVTFIIADSPCHGSHFSSTIVDDYPGGTPGVDILLELKRLQSNTSNGTMTINFGRITNYTEQMLLRFKEGGINIDVVDLADTSKLTKCVTKTVRKSIFKTCMLTSGGGKSVAFAPLKDPSAMLGAASARSLSARSKVSLKDYRIRPSKPAPTVWKTREAAAVKVFQNRRIKSMGQLKQPIGVGILSYFGAGAKVPSKTTDKTQESNMFMRRASEPFAEGEIRIAYHGQLARQKKDLEDPYKSSVVLKSFKHHGEGVNDRSQYLKQIEVSSIAYFLAQEYNKSTDRPSRCAKICVLKACVVEEEDELNERHGSRRFCVEEPLPDDAPFVKFSNNTGHWDEDHLDETLLRFTDFTYKATAGYLMVTDLQGVKKRNGGYVLTDPVILCTDVLRFGNTNLGGDFMNKCISSTRALLAEHGWHLKGI